MSAWPGATAQPSGPGSMGEGDDRDTVDGLDVCGSDGRVDGDRPGVAAHRIFRWRVAAAAGVRAVACVAVAGRPCYHRNGCWPLAVGEVGGVDRVCGLVDRDPIRVVRDPID